MCTNRELEEYQRLLKKYYKGRKVDREDLPVLSKLESTHLIVMYSKGDTEYAKSPYY